jgi:hypothetical protein
LESHLERRTSSYNPDEEDDIKVFLAVSGAGKTRTLLELLYSRYGYYFVMSSSSSFGSQDLRTCMTYCEAKSGDLIEVDRAIRLLLFVRTSVCKLLIENGITEPKQILLAQIHPVDFFGLDLFAVLYSDILNVNLSQRFVASSNPFPFIAIDEIQISLEGLNLFRLPVSKSARPFFSPLVYYIKHNFRGRFVL